MGSPVSCSSWGSGGGDVPAILMCGGRGARLGTGTEKPLVEIGGEPMVAHVLRALAESQIGTIHAVVSPHTPDTASFLRDHARSRIGAIDLEVVCGTGEGYVADLDAALNRVGRSAVTAAADLPLLRPDHVDDAIARARGNNTTECTSGDDADPGNDGYDPNCAAGDVSTTIGSLTVCVPVELKRSLTVSVDIAFTHGDREVAPTGLNVVGEGDERVAVCSDPALAVNVNRPTDLAIAREQHE